LLGAPDNRLMLHLLLASAASPTAVGGSVTPPAFADSFYVGAQASLTLNQNGYKKSDGKICCALDSAGCKVQMQSAGNDVREQVSMNRTRIDGGRGSIVTWFGDVQKQMAVVPGSAVNSTHKWACMQYCPTTTSFMPTLEIGEGKSPKVQDLGQASITQPAAIGGATKQCEHYKYTERLIIVPMSVTDFYVDESAKPAAPFYKHLLLEPFGKKEGFETSYFLGYQPMDTSDYFDIDMDPKLCKKSTKCNQQEALEAHLAEHTASAATERFFARSYYDLALDEAHRLERESKKPLVVSNPPPPPNVTFGGDFVASEDALMLVNQGGLSGVGEAPGDICCPPEAPGCQVQLSHSQGTRYFDLSHQRTRFDDALSGRIIVDDYSLHKSYAVTVDGGVEKCQDYCPIDVNDTMRPFSPFSPFDAVKDLGATTFKGRPAEHYQWAEKVLKVITMSTTDLFIDQTDKAHAVPLFMTEELTPLGRHLGTQNHTWTNWTATTPPAAKFAVQGVDTCPLAKNCGSHEKAFEALRSRNFHTFARSMMTPM